MSREIKAIRKATKEATEELEKQDIRYTNAIKDFLVWLDLVKKKLLKHLN